MTASTAPPTVAPPNRQLEIAWKQRGYTRVAGIDEAGRGPIAGPVVAAAVLLPDEWDAHAGLQDSKKLSPARRNHWFTILQELPGVQIGVAVIPPDVIDQLNILRATHLAMRKAVEAMPSPPPDFALVDGLPVTHLPIPHEAVVKGDTFCLNIAAASIIAKVTRDRIMHEAAQHYPHYHFDRHKGYPTQQHLATLRIHGPSPIHRHSFAPVAQLALLPQSPPAR